MQTIKTPKTIASEILVRPAPNGARYFNGFLNLADAIAAREPATSSMPARVVELMVKCVANELRLVRPVMPARFNFEIEPMI